MREESRIDMEHARMLLKKKVNSRMSAPGDYEVGIPGVRLFRRDQAQKTEACLYTPVIIKIVQGVKRAVMGSGEYSYGENEVLVSGVDMPGTSMVVEASPDVPCTGITVDLDKNLIAQLAPEIPHKVYSIGSVAKGILVQPLEADILDAFLRLAELLDKSDRISVFAPMIIREIHYLLLDGPSGHWLRSFHMLGSQSNQIAQAIFWLKQNLAATVQIEDLAARVNMAPSTFHRYFKEVTAMSPIQFQKRLRLHEAQRLMLLNDLDAGSACLAVGYESSSQFNREYKRLFGEPPLRNIKKLREEVITSA
ncbi:AraC family transcriptional regulator N-terminal domain-containing protein [Desulfovibrio aminophilus]|uniref:AraC family transcriptional regulator n=1 Tax=Desulfovibrio aminophilus TaxID=81425 RepID=UPI003398CD0B